MQAKQKTPRGIWVLRGVTIAVVVVLLLVVGTVAYSAYEDYNAVRGKLAGGSQQAVGTVVFGGTNETVSLNIPIPNGGLYPLNVTVTCEWF